MHELQVTERILEVALEHASRHEVTRIVAVHLRVGELSDLEDEWLDDSADCEADVGFVAGHDWKWFDEHALPVSPV